MFNGRQREATQALDCSSFKFPITRRLPKALLDFENYSKNVVFLLSFEREKQISPLLTPLEKFLEKSTSENPSDVHGRE